MNNDEFVYLAPGLDQYRLMYA